MKIIARDRKWKKEAKKKEGIMKRGGGRREREGERESWGGEND